jgi:PAS domain S-box-containing protein
MQLTDWAVTWGVILFVALFWWALRERHWLKQQINQQQQGVQAIQEELKQLSNHHRQKTEECRRTEDKLRSYLELMDTLINTIPNPVYFKGIQGTYRGCNRAFAKTILGLSRDRIIGNRPEDLSGPIPAQLAAIYVQYEQKMIENRGVHTFEAEVLCADGRRHEFLFNIASVVTEDAKTQGFVGVMLDLTEKNRAARDRLQKEKLQGALEVAGAVCHEFNQPLQALMGYAEMALAGANGNESEADHLSKILEQAARMAQLTDKLQNITRYETMLYADNTPIIDIHKASQS